MTTQKTENENMKVGEKTQEEKTYIVSWLYMANHGVEEVLASSEEEAIKSVWGGQTDKIRYIVSEKKDNKIFVGEN